MPPEVSAIIRSIDSLGLNCRKVRECVEYDKAE